MKSHAYNLDHLLVNKISIEDLKRQEEKNRIKPRTGENIYCFEDYAPALYEKYTGYLPAVNDVNRGDIIQGEIVSISLTEITLDIKYKFPVYIYLQKETPENREVLKKKKPGDKLNVYIDDLIRVENYTTGAWGSISKIETLNTLNNINQAIKHQEQEIEPGKDQVFDAKIEELVDGGYLVDINGVKAFLPGSLAAPNKIIDFNSKLGETIKVVPVSYSEGKKYLVVSHKQYIKQLIPNLINNLQFNNKEYEGFVTGTTKFGIFVEFNEYLTGLIHVSELNEETKKRHQQQIIKPGEKIIFFVKEVTNNNRIILTQVEENLDPWKSFSVKVPSTIKTKIISKTSYGLFLEIEPGIVGLLHISEMSGISPDIYNKGDNIIVQVNKIDPEQKKIYFSLE
jgi:small subunit ribosomal protein S1